jgi:hypothetical protein
MDAVLPGRCVLSVRVLDAPAVGGSPEIAENAVTGHRIGKPGQRCQHP